MAMNETVESTTAQAAEQKAIAVDEQDIVRLRDGVKRLEAEVAKVIVGQHEVVKETMIAILARAHALLMGVPGLGKTLLVRTIGGALGLDFSRIQFTPDLMPSDIVGTEIIEEVRGTGERNFRFIKGPIFRGAFMITPI